MFGNKKISCQDLNRESAWIICHLKRSRWEKIWIELILHGVIGAEIILFLLGWYVIISQRQALIGGLLLLVVIGSLPRLLSAYGYHRQLSSRARFVMARSCSGVKIGEALIAMESELSNNDEFLHALSTPGLADSQRIELVGLESRRRYAIMESYFSIVGDLWRQAHIELGLVKSL